MKLKLHTIVVIGCLLAPLASIAQSPVAPAASVAVAGRTNALIPWSELGSRAGADYKGDGLAVTPNGKGARLHCAFQHLDGEATREGLWLTSKTVNTVNDRFRVVATAVGRQAGRAERGASERRSVETPQTHNTPRSDAVRLPDSGTVAIDAQTVRFTRPGMVEEYTVSMDGVRQDFVVLERPAGTGDLAVRLAVSGARVEPSAGGAQLVLENCGRKIAYSRLRVTDATGKELTARMGVMGSDGESQRDSIALLVNDTDAVYPVRIDPTFSDANWISMGGIRGASDIVIAAVVDGSGNLYVGGYFTIVGDVIANYVAKWNGSSWSALGSGINGFGVSVLAVSGSDVYAASGGYVAKWNGSSWTALGSGMNDDVSALAVSGSDVYAASGGYVAKWNGSSWTVLGSGMDYGSYVYALAVSGSNVYAGGAFNTAGGIAATNIAKWDGSSWSALGSGPNNGVSALAVSGSDVYAGGFFTTAGGRAANRIAKWDGSSWSALGSGVDYPGLGSVSALAVSGSNVYAGGGFTTAGGSAANYIAKWDGSSWSALGSGMDNVVYALAVSGSNVYAGGGFTTAGGSVANYIGKWDGNSWSALGSGIVGGGSALAVSGSDLYAGGYFTTAGGSAANYIAKWDGSSWTALGSGTVASVSSLAVSGSDVYAASGGYVAKWNGSSWTALGSGMNNVVYALAVSGSDLYAGGYFTTAGGSAANYIAKWDGSSWSALDSGMGGIIYPAVLALAVSGGDLYAGGRFKTAGGSAANYIAKWDGSSWSALGSGMGSTAYFPVEALAVSGSDLYAGGYFTTAGGSAANSIAKWDGNSWTALGSGIDNVVSALAVSGSNVYAGGNFKTAGSSVANSIAKWDGSSWTALGSGLGGGNFGNTAVYALAVSGSDLYAGGGFRIAGGKVSAYIARAYLLPLPALSVLHSGANVMVSWPLADTASFTLEQAATPSAPASWVSTTASITDDGTTKSVTLPATNRVQFFRLRRP